MARINILHSSHEGRVRLNLNGDEFILMVPRDGKGEATVPDQFLPLLTDSNIDYEIIAPVAGNDEAEAGAGGDSGAVSAEADGPIPGADPEAGPGSLGTVDESSKTAMPATPPVATPQTPAPPEAPVTLPADLGKETPPVAPAAKPKRVRKPAAKKAKADAAK